MCLILPAFSSPDLKAFPLHLRHYRSSGSAPSLQIFRGRAGRDCVFRVSLLPVTPDLIKHLHFVLKLHITHTSGGIRPGLMRSFLSMPTESPDRIQVLIPDYKNAWHLDTSVIAGLTGNHQQYQSHIRYFLIDSQTGYRSREQQISVRFKV